MLHRSVEHIAGSNKNISNKVPMGDFHSIMSWQARRFLSCDKKRETPFTLIMSSRRKGEAGKHNEVDGIDFLKFHSF